MTSPDRVFDLWFVTAIALGGLFPLCAIAWAFDGRLLGSESVWAKPMKFALSLAIHFLTLALALRLVAPQSASSTLLWAIALASVAAAVFEMSYIVVQAARQQPSHFNLSTPFYAAMYVLMALGAVAITVAAGAVGLAALLQPAPDVSRALQWAVVIGLAGGTILTLVTAFRMGGALDHHNGVEAAEAARMPLTGWSLTVGDRRVPHFLATHMMQAIPVAGLLAERLMKPAAAVFGVVAFSAIWIAATLIAFRQANAGLALTRWPFG